MDRTKNVQYPQTAEPAMHHPFNTSTIKIRDNGMIDFFVDKDHGMRLDPNTYTWNLIINGEKHHVDYIRGWVTQDVRWDVGRSWAMYLGTDLIVKAGGSMYFTAGGIIKMRATNIYLN